MAATFNEQWAEHGAWQREFSFLLRLFSQWLKDNALLDAAAQERIQRLEQRVRSDKVVVAFVAEFSRGKSEMINAIFFADYGRRIMPTSAGRTTMCPTELAYSPDILPSLRLLPIQTRLQPQALADWRNVPEAWTTVALNVHSAEQLAQSFAHVTETVQVRPEEAQALGFWHAQTPQDNPPLDAQGLVQVPKWRHALINIAHPLLKQGLVILDTPGLNALGAEPELTVGLIDQAHALVFILGADTGVTRSDLALWQEHLRPGPAQAARTWVVLNKMDTLWDELSTSAQIQAQMDAQKTRTAQSLGVERAQVLAVSAQKGLVAKVSNNAALLERSGLLVLEAALADGLLGERRVLLPAAINEAIAGLRTAVAHTLATQRRDLDLQRAELQGLQGKSLQVLHELRDRIGHERQQFELACTKTLAFKTVQNRIFQNLLDQLDPKLLVQEMQALADTLGQRGLKWGVKKAYAATFDRLRLQLQRAQEVANDLAALQAGAFAQVNTEFGFALQPVAPLELNACAMDLALAQRSHLSYLGLRNVLRLQQPEFIGRLVRALSSRLEVLQGVARADAEQWRQSVLAQLETQISLRRTYFASRLETVKKIERVAGGFEQRLDHIAGRTEAINALAQKLDAQAACLVATNEDSWREPAHALV